MKQVTNQIPGSKKSNSRIFARIAKIYWILIFALMPSLSHAAAVEFKTGMQKGLGIGVIITFGLCVFFIWEGIYEFRRGGNYGKDIIGLLISAGAFSLVTTLFTAFAINVSIDPTF